MIVENNKELKYKYSVFTWGGFYNKQYNHGYKEGKRVFDSHEQRQEYILALQAIEIAMEAKHLCMTLDEGFAVDIPIILHRVTKYGEIYYYSKNIINTASTNDDCFSGVSYIMNWKWTPGFNDEPIGDSDKVDYEHAEVVQEWITGAFKPQE